MKKRMLIIAISAIGVLMLVSFSSCENPSEFNYEPEIVTQPKDLTVYLGDTISTNCLTVEAIDAEGDEIFYQWYLLVDTINGENMAIPGATENVFIPNKSVADTNIYFATVRGASGNIPASEGATVIVIDTLIHIETLK